MRYLFFLTCLLSTLLVKAEGSISLVDDTLPQGVQSRFLVFPFAIKSPETKAGFGLAGAFFFKAKKNEKNIRTSDVNLLSLYTLRKQLVLVLNSSVFFSGEEEILRFQGSYSFYPDRFWGVGNHSNNGTREDYRIRQYFFNPQLLFRVLKKWYIGGNLEFQRVYDFDYDQGGIFDREQVVGRYGGITAGIGLLFTWDTRNNAFSPSTGFFAELNTTRYNHLFNSDFNFVSHTFDFRKFFRLHINTVLATQVVLKLNSGEVPVRNLALIGGPELMRGYWKGRWADKNMIAFQAEVRHYLFWRLGVVGFAGMAQVNNSTKNFAIDEFHYSFGGGTRILLQEKEKLNLRIDYGFGTKSSGLYITLKEAF